MKYKRTIATAIALCSGVCALGSVVTDAQAASARSAAPTTATTTGATMGNLVVAANSTRWDNN